MSNKFNIDKYIGNKIKYYREKKNVSQKELGEFLNTTSQTISRYESGTRGTNQDVLFALADYFGISINEFFPPTSSKNVTTIATDDETGYKVQLLSNEPYENLTKEEQEELIEMAMDQLYEMKKNLKKDKK